MRSSGETYLDKVDLVEAIIASRLLDIKDGDDVFVVEVAQQLHLSQCSQTEHGVVEGGNLLDSHLLPGRLVNGRAAPMLLESGRVKLHPSRPQVRISRNLPNDSVGSLANDILDVILLTDVEGDFA